jgi:hypothetical protein
MPGVNFHARNDGGAIPILNEVLVGKSTWIRAGDLLVFTTVADRTASARVVRPHYSGEDDTIDNSIGVAGVALYEIRTDSNAKLISPGPGSGAVTLSGVQVLYDVPTVEYAQYDTTSGYVKAVVARWCSSNLFRMPFQTGDTFANTLLGTKLGIVSSTTLTLADPTAVTYAVDIDETSNNILVIRDWTPRDSVSIATAALVTAIVEPLDSTDAMIMGTPSTA